MAWRWAASRGTMVHPMGEWPVSEPVVEPTLDGFVDDDDDDDDDEIDVYDDDESTTLPIKRLAFYQKRCEKCGYPKTRKVRA